MTSKTSPPSASASFLLTEEEKRLLKKLQKTVTPLKKNRVDFFSSPAPLSSKKLSPSQVSSPPSFPRVLSPNISLPQKRAPKEVPLPALEKHTARKIKSKHYAFSATLDLHGMTQERAHEKLIFFIEHNLQKDKRSLLIITGKGQGILKRSLLVWLQSPSLRPLIASVEQSLPHHGGEGAFYVILRKKKDF